MRLTCVGEDETVGPFEVPFVDLVGSSDPERVVVPIIRAATRKQTRLPLAPSTSERFAPALEAVKRLGLQAQC